MEDTKSEINTVLLRPFAHQVGGHSNFQQFDNYTVCKPLFSKELKFYQEMPSALKPFIPKFKGQLPFLAY
jgi:inositol-hexakisphosphate kinase